MDREEEFRTNLRPVVESDLRRGVGGESGVNDKDWLFNGEGIRSGLTKGFFALLLEEEEV